MTLVSFSLRCEEVTIPLACPSGQSVLLDSSLAHHQQNTGAVKCEGPAVSPLTQ